MPGDGLDESTGLLYVCQAGMTPGLGSIEVLGAVALECAADLLEIRLSVEAELRWGTRGDVLDHYGSM
jgi:hypothetical protein